MNDVCGFGAPNIALVVSVPRSIYSPFRILSRVRGVTGGSGVLCKVLSGGKVGGLVP